MKTTVTVSINTTVQVDTTDLDEDATLSDHFEAAETEVRSWNWSVGKGAGKSESFPADVKILGVNLVPAT